MAKGYTCEHDSCFVVHQDWDCPLCLAEKNIKELEETINELESKNE